MLKSRAQPVALGLHSLLLLGLGLAAWLSAPTGPNREPDLGGVGGFVFVTVMVLLPSLSLAAAVALWRRFAMAQRGRTFGRAAAALLAAAFAGMVVGGIVEGFNTDDDSFPAVWLISYFLVLPVALLLLLLAAAWTRVIPRLAAILLPMTWWGYESLATGGSLTSVWTTALAAGGWIWTAATSGNPTRPLQAHTVVATRDQA